ncbi:MAG: hypothetical protein ACLUHE_17165 [Christensenellales bacterium]
MPNAGYPHVEEGRDTYYDSAPTYYAQQVMGCVEGGRADCRRSAAARRLEHIRADCPACSA